MVQDTSYDLQLHLQRIDEKLEQFTVDNTNGSDIKIDLNNEREVTKQCLHICEDARTYIESLTNRESSLLQEAARNDAEGDARNCFEAQALTRQALDENRDSFAEISRHLQERLLPQALNGDRMNDSERLRLQEDINTAKQCLEVCKVASEASRQKIYRVGEVIAKGNSDQVVVDTLSDLFDVQKASSTDSSAQLVGSMRDDSLRHLTERRYSSRFGAVVSDSNLAGAKTTGSASASETQTSKHAIPPQTGSGEQSPRRRTKWDRPSPNEMKKRTMDGSTKGGFNE